MLARKGISYHHYSIFSPRALLECFECPPIANGSCRFKFAPTLRSWRRSEPSTAYCGSPSRRRPLDRRWVGRCNQRGFQVLSLVFNSSVTFSTRRAIGKRIEGCEHPQRNG